MTCNLRLARLFGLCTALPLLIGATCNVDDSYSCPAYEFASESVPAPVMFGGEPLAACAASYRVTERTDGTDASFAGLLEVRCDGRTDESPDAVVSFVFNEDVRTFGVGSEPFEVGASASYRDENDGDELCLFHPVSTSMHTTMQVEVVEASGDGAPYPMIFEEGFVRVIRFRSTPLSINGEELRGPCLGALELELDATLTLSAEGLTLMPEERCGP